MFRIHKGLTCGQTVCNNDHDTSELRLFKESSRELVPAAWGAKSTMINNRSQGCNQPVKASLGTDRRSRQATTVGLTRNVRGRRCKCSLSVYFTAGVIAELAGVSAMLVVVQVTLTMLLHAQTLPQIHDLRCKTQSC